MLSTTLLKLLRTVCGRFRFQKYCGSQKYPLSWWWQVQDSNLRSFRDGFTVRSHWPLGQPAA
jgi:hypothetical protein